MRTMQKTAILLLLTLSLLAMNACQWGTVPGHESGTMTENVNPETEAQTTCSQMILDAQNQAEVMDELTVPMLVFMYSLTAHMDQPVYIPQMSRHQPLCKPKGWDSYMLDENHTVCIVRTEDATGEVYNLHLIYGPNNPNDPLSPYATENEDENWVLSGKYLFTSSASATADTTLLKPGVSVRSLLDSFPELGLYCKVDDRFPFAVSGDVYAGPAVLMVNEGFFLITTGLSEDGTDVLIKEVTKQDTLTYEDLCQLYGG
ncbi:MAG: hypothetical protein ACI4WV_08285 [Eubacteriales bacterium]